MDYPEIDKLFDDAFEHLDQKTIPLSSAYREGPLASDHFLVKKSWDYFRQRVKMLEDQNAEIVKAKESQIEALHEEMKGLEEKLATLSEETRSLRLFEEAVKEMQSGEYADFQKRSDRIKLSWEEERQRVEEQLTRARVALDLDRKKAEQRETHLNQQIKELHRTIDVLKKDDVASSEQRLELEKKQASQVEAKDDLIQSLERKVDLMRGEIERRDHLLRTMDEEKALRTNELGVSKDKVKELNQSILDLTKQLEHAATELRMGKDERETLRASWQKEQAQYRELWERERQTWEHQKKQLRELEDQVQRLSSPPSQ